MKYQKICEDIIEFIGGKENIESVTHCITRLRFCLLDESIAETDKISQLKSVLKVVRAGGQYQVVIGTFVGDVYKDLIQILGKVNIDTSTDDKAQQIDYKPDSNKSKSSSTKSTLLSQFLNMMTNIFQPILSMFMVGGMIKAILKLCILAGWGDTSSGTYVVFNGLGDSIFYFLPVVLGWSAARRFGLKEVYGITLGAVLTYPGIIDLSHGKLLFSLFKGTFLQQNVLSTFLGIPMILPMQSYAGSVIPIILIVFIASKIYHFLNHSFPSYIRSFFVPFFTLLIVVPLALLVIGPIAMVLQDILSEAIKGLVGLNPGVAGFFLGTFWSVLVMMGLHMAVIPMFALNISQYGYDIINPLIFSGALASMGSVLGVVVRTTSISEKNICIPALISSFFGINEPSLYGVLIPRKKIMYTSFLSAGIGAAAGGFGGAKMYSFGASGPLGLPSFINPTGLDFGFLCLLVGAIVSFLLAFIFAFILGPKKDIESTSK